MTQDIEIEVNLNSLVKRTNVTGEIYFKIDYHRYFPEQDWSDFVVIILSWWIKSFKGIITSNIGQIFKFDFMDGPPIVYGKKISNDQIELSFCEVDDKEVSFSAVCTVIQFRHTLLSTAKKVIRLTERNNWCDEDIEELRDLVLSLEKYTFKK